MSNDATTAPDPALQIVLTSLEGAARERRVDRMPAPVLVEYARMLHAAFEGAQARSPYQARLARWLVFLYDHLDRRLNAAAVDPRHDADVRGLSWTPHSPLDQTLEAIPPFGMRDFWVAALAGPAPARRVRLRPLPVQRLTNVPGVDHPTGTLPAPVGADVVGVLPHDDAPSTPASTASQVVEVVNFAAGVAELGLDIAAFATASFVVGMLGAGLAVAGSVIGFIATFQEADRTAAWNGRNWMFAAALNFFAYDFRDDALDRTPLERWPALDVASLARVQGSLHRPVENPDASGRAWLQGEAEGYANAVAFLRQLERTPREVPYTDPASGRRLRVRVSGREFLRAIYRSSGGQVYSEVVRQIMQRHHLRRFPALPNDFGHILGGAPGS